MEFFQRCSWRLIVERRELNSVIALQPDLEMRDYAMGTRDRMVGRAYSTLDNESGRTPIASRTAGYSVASRRAYSVISVRARGRRAAWHGKIRIFAHQEQLGG